MNTVYIEKLSLAEKVELMEAIWEDLSKTAVTAPAWYEQVLRQTEGRVDRELEAPVDWNEAKNQLRSRFA